MSRFWTALLFVILAVDVGAQTPVPFPPPDTTTWAPEGCRIVPAGDPVLGPRTAWRNLHADAQNTDEVSSALAPVFAADWRTETNTFNPTGPVFDAEGNLYFTPLLPFDDLVLYSLDPDTGARRFAIAGTGGGAASPMVLDDPQSPGDQIVYVGLYDRALAVDTDGNVVWDVGTGLTLPSLPLGAFGVNYHPATDSIVGLTSDGMLYALDRTSGAPILNDVFSLPGAPAPPPANLPPQSFLDGAAVELAACMDFPPGADAGALIAALLGGGSEVANHFSIDPGSGRIWVSATAPDAEDGTADGVSDLGALYGLDLVPNGAGFDVVEVCHRSFVGGSASTPAVSPDGSRIYVGDAVGGLIAVDSSCNDVWTFDVGAQLVGSVGVSSDNDELYVATANDIFQIIDQGDAGAIGWTADLDVYEGSAEQNLNLYTIGANGIGFQAAAKTNFFGRDLPRRTGVGLLDRATGEPRFFADGFDETVAVMSTGPDGAIYVGSSPVRRAFSRVVWPADPPLECGIRKFAPMRLDLLMRDALHAAADRAANAHATAGTCPDAVAADVVQIDELIAQTEAAAPGAIAAGDLSADAWADASAAIALAEAQLAASNLDPAATQLALARDIVAGSVTSVPSIPSAAGRGVWLAATALIGWWALRARGPRG